MSLSKEFREFAVKGSVVDLAVGVIIGGAFGKIVTSFVEDIVLPPIGKLLGGFDFTNAYLPLDAKVKQAAEQAAASGQAFGLADAKKAGAVLAYGNFLNTVVQFAILAFVVFLLVRSINKLRSEPEPVAPEGPAPDVALLTEIRDLLAKR